MLAAEPDSPNIYSDMKGPLGFERRFWVKTADKINFEDVQERQKILKLSEAEKKKDVSQDDIDLMYKRIMSGQDRIGGGSSSPGKVAKMLVANTAGDLGIEGSAFDSDLMDLPDVSALLPENAGDDGDGDEEEAVKQEGGEGGRE